MPTEVLFTIVILVRKNPHLLPLTLESLAAQSEKGYEILLIDGLKTGRIQEIAQGFSIPIRILQIEGDSEAELMNRAIGESRGTYVQFLYPGDRYISQQALSYLSELIQDSSRPQLVYCAFLQRDLERPPQAISFPLNIQSLKKGVFPTMYRTSWLLKEEIQNLGGFNRYLTYRPSFDLLCRLFLKPGMRAVYTRRVLTDYELGKSSSRALMGYAAETFRILYRHFGIRPALRWLFGQDHSRMLRWVLQHLKRSFRKKSSSP